MLCYFFPSPLFLKLGVTAVLNSSSPSSDDGVIQSLKTFTAAGSKIFKIQSSFSNREHKEGGQNETLPSKMLSSCNGDKSVLRMQEKRPHGDMCFLEKHLASGHSSFQDVVPSSSLEVNL